MWEKDKQPSQKIRSKQVKRKGVSKKGGEPFEVVGREKKLL